MTGKRTINLYIDGTSALKPDFDVRERNRATIIPFPGHHAAIKHIQLMCDRADAAEAREPLRSILKRMFYSVFASSEMLCSLLFEDVRGCPYQLFTKRSIAAISASMTLIAVASLAFGC